MYNYLLYKMKLPNILTLVRVLLIPIIAVLLYSKNSLYIILSIVLLIIGITSDWLDGFIARRKGLISVFGTFFDPIADKMLILTMLFIFADLRLIPLWMVLIILFRELLVSGVRQICSNSKKIIGSNWMGKTKFIMQTIVIIYLQIFLYFEYSNQQNLFFTKTIAYYVTLILAIISFIFALKFAYLHRKEIASSF